MKAKLFNESGEVTFEPEEVEHISIEFGGYSILIKWKYGEWDRAVYVSI